MALAAGGALLFGAPARSGEPQPLALSAAWPRAQRGSVPSKLPDGNEYSPALFLDAKTSAGTAQSPDGHTLRLILRQADGTLRELRRVPSTDRAPFAALTSYSTAPTAAGPAASATAPAAPLSATSASAASSPAPLSATSASTAASPAAPLPATSAPLPGTSASAAPTPATSGPAPAVPDSAASASAVTAPAPAAAGSGDGLVWVESVRGKQQLWTGGLRQPARMLTADVGAMQFYDSQYDLVIANGAVHWVAGGAADQTEFRSVALTGGRVTVTRSAGTWALSAWPWAVDGQTSARGATTLRNLTTGRRIAVPSADRTVTACSPAWCQLVSLNADGYARMELSHPDGSARRKVAEGTVATAITDVAVLDRFEVLARVGPQSDLSGNQELLIHDLRTRQTVLVSPDAGNIAYRAGVLWWSTGDQSSFVRNSLDLRTI